MSLRLFARTATLLVLPGFFFPALLRLPAAAGNSAPQTPLPNAATLLHEVEAHQAQLDRAREDYTFRAVQTTRQLDKNGSVKRIETEETEIFFVNGHRIQKLIAKNGKKLDPGQAKNEQERIGKEVQKDLRLSYGSVDKDEITVARLLQIVTFSNPRRLILNGRNTIAFDFMGDARAKTHGRNEDALKKIFGTLWVDETDREVSRMSATLDDNYHLGFGLLASVAKGSNVVFNQALIRNEAWLPTSIELHVQAKALLLIGFRAEVDIRFDDYRKFQTDAVEQPGATVNQTTPK